MKNILFVFFALAMHCNNNLQINTEKNTVIQVKLIDKLDSIEYKGLKGNFYSVNLELFNKTNKIMKFWTMTCSWQVNWISSSDSLRLYNPGCPKNFPIVQEIKPNSKVVLQGVICLENPLRDLKDKKYKLGLVLVKKNEVVKNSDFFKVLSDKVDNKKDIIWSEPFRIDK